MPLGKYLSHVNAVMDFKSTHIMLPFILFFKEVFVFFTCVRRAYEKLKAENKNEPVTEATKVHDDFYLAK
jgi:hypothetical protein